MIENVSSYAEFEKKMEYDYWLSRGTRTPHRMFFYPLVGTLDPSEAFAAASERDPKFSATVTPCDSKLSHVAFGRRWGGQQVSAHALILRLERGSVVASDDAQQRPLSGLIDRLDPLISSVHVNSRDLLNLARKVAVAFKGFDCEVYYLAARKPGKQTIQAYENVNLDQMTNYVEEGYWIERLKFRVSREAEVILDFGVERSGRVGFYEGNFDGLRSAVLGPLLSVGVAKLEFYSSRGRTPDGKRLTPRPLTIKSALDVALDKRIASLLIKHIRKFPKLSYAVVHAGNPMLQVHIVDEEDGSAYDIAGTDDRIFLVPTMSVTPSALVRARELVFRALREGVVEDYYEQRPEPAIDPNYTTAM